MTTKAWMKHLFRLGGEWWKVAEMDHFVRPVPGGGFPAHDINGYHYRFNPYTGRQAVFKGNVKIKSVSSEAEGWEYIKAITEREKTSDIRC
ncbi:hypothetical protein FACS1894109_17730 [Spirochaetia bacterium]|nr:hypothetical protein FACS1894109_17730 [Spirochaetia bacterium]